MARGATSLANSPAGSPADGADPERPPAMAEATGGCSRPVNLALLEPESAAAGEVAVARPG